MIGGVAMLGGSVAGGVIAQATSLGVPFLLRVGVLLAMFVVAYGLMHDLGFTPEPRAHPLRATRDVFDASLEHGLKNPPVRWIMLAAPFASGVGIYTFYALQPYLLELYGDPDAYSVAGLAAAIVAGLADLGGYAAPKIRGLFEKRTTALILGTAPARDPGVARRHRILLGGAGAAGDLGADLRGRDADPPGLSQRHDPVEAARHSAVVRLADGQQRRRRDPAGAREDGRRLQLLDVVRRRRGVPAARRAVPLRQPPRASPGGHGGQPGGRPGSAVSMVTVEDVRSLALGLPRTTEALVRGRVKFRVGQIVYVSRSRTTRP